MIGIEDGRVGVVSRLLDIKFATRMAFVPGTVAVLFTALVFMSTVRDAQAGAAVWIDTDSACGMGQTVDVDDCWAILQAFGSPELSIRGISTVFGNHDGRDTFAVARAR